MPNILVTGGSGFVGRHLINEMSERGLSFKLLDRSEFSSTPQLCNETVDVVIHLAGRAHILNETSDSPYAEFYEANCQLALQIARMASAGGAKRFVYVSSVGVYGKSCLDEAINEQAALTPIEDYAKSKLVAEVKLKELSEKLGFELVIVRPALVYGFDAPGNIQRLLEITAKLPLIPIAEKKNKRSFVYVDNLVDFLLLSASHANAAGKVFNVSDDPISTYELLKGFAIGMKRKPLLFSSPRCVWKALLCTVGQKKMYEQLFEDLQIDTSFARRELGWQPKHETSTALNKTGQLFNQNK